jgi:hypothetical protein
MHFTCGATKPLTSEFLIKARLVGLPKPPSADPDGFAEEIVELDIFTLTLYASQMGTLLDDELFVITELFMTAFEY